MQITRVQASNWRNFTSLNIAVENRLFIVGPNAAGKSNLLDIFRFLGDIAGVGGGLSAAMDKRGGFGKVRSLFARNHQHGRVIIDIHLSDGEDRWRYRLAIRGEGSGRNRPFVAEEVVKHDGEILLQRPDADDKQDSERLTQTHLEQISSNQKFRALAEFFAKTRYFHLVPQVIRDPSRVGLSPNDPYGGDFIAQMNRIQDRTRKAWLKRMERALRAAVPGFSSLRLEPDAAGRPHLIADYQNGQINPTQQNESEFSDGTLRLIGLLWTLVSTPSNGGILLLEEPELSLNSAIIRTLPAMLATAQRDRRQQVLLSTHAPEILDGEGVRPEEILVLQLTTDGTQAKLLSEIGEVAGEVAAELPKSEIVDGLISPGDLSDLSVVGRGR